MKTTIAINGMHCASCEGVLTDVLTEIEGVQSAKVSFKHKNAQVEFDEKKTAERALRTAIEKEGYTTG